MRAATIALRPLMSTHRRSRVHDVSDLVVPADRAEVLFAALLGCVKQPFEYSTVAAVVVTTLWREALVSAWGVVDDLATLALRLL